MCCSSVGIDLTTALGAQWHAVGGGRSTGVEKAAGLGCFSAQRPWGRIPRWAGTHILAAVVESPHVSKTAYSAYTRL